MRSNDWMAVASDASMTPLEAPAQGVLPPGAGQPN